MSAITTDEWTQTITTAIRAEYGGPKELAHAAGSNLETARNWWGGRHAPAGAYLCRLMGQSEKVLGAVLRLSGHVELADLAEFDHAMEQAKQRARWMAKRLSDTEAALD
jgi:hypothetical protein